MTNNIAQTSLQRKGVGELIRIEVDRHTVGGRDAVVGQKSKLFRLVAEPSNSRKARASCLASF